ncbi:uncharacterized protein Dyak_GE25095 [Drosophila yakuba]|uniref:Uncharacterized protein n=1 Tax=Drosophila yakuba TaxID=7245 RepID=B4PP54_DROYA|nr:uncharacterized protein Dyak_GE25095 [Drosophila yakuba]
MAIRLNMMTLCRTCLQDGEAQMVSIFQTADDKLSGGVSLCDKIESLSGIQIKAIEEDALPTRICLRCKAFLTLAHKFRQICQRSNEFLREYVVQQVGPATQPIETEQYESLEEELLEEGVWSTEDPIVETPPERAEKEIPTVLTVQTLPAPYPASEPAPAVAVTAKLHVCEICGNGYPRKSTLDTHMRRHNDERPYECEICHKSFHVNYQLKRHIRQHTGAKPYTCQYCHRSFADRTSLVKHERTHRNERPYACHTCGKKFTYASVLKMHYKTHTGEKPYICQLCNKSFARIHNLVAHLQTQQHINDPQLTGYLSTFKVGNTVANA